MALVNDNQVKKISGVLVVEPGPVRVLGEGLVDRKVHFAAFNGFPIDLVAGFAERKEYFVLWVVNENVPIGQEQDSRAAVLARLVPSRVPELPTDLEGDHGLPRASSEREQHSLLALENRLDSAVDGDLLVVAWRLTAQVVGGREKSLGGLVGDALGAFQSRPQLLGGREPVDTMLLAGDEVMLEDLLAVGAIRELQPEDLRVILRLLDAVSGESVDRFCFDNSNWIVAPVP